MPSTIESTVTTRRSDLRGISTKRSDLRGASPQPSTDEVANMPRPIDDDPKGAGYLDVQPTQPEPVNLEKPYCYDFPRPSVTVDIILFTFQEEELKVLLIRRKRAPFCGHWALPGGFVEIDEDLEAAALRELWEETNVSDIYLEQLYTFGAPHRDPRTRVITVAYFALLSAEQAQRLQLRSADDADDVRWWNVYALPDLAFDHDRILQYAVQRLRWKLEWTALGFLLLPSEFTLSELQKVYETVLHEPIDKRNFRRKMLAADVLEETGNLREGDHRPAKLYRFTAKAIEIEQARRRFP